MAETDVDTTEEEPTAAQVGEQTRQFREFLTTPPERPVLDVETFRPSFLKTQVQLRRDQPVQFQATVEEGFADQSLMQALRAHPDITDEQIASSQLIAQHQQTVLSRTQRGFDELTEGYTNDWVSRPFNFTALEIESITRGVDAGTLIGFEAANAVYEDQSEFFQQNKFAVAKGVAFQEIQFETSVPWMEFQGQFGEKLGQEFMDSLALGMATDMGQDELNQFISEFGVELQNNRTLLDNQEGRDDILGRMIIRSQQIQGQFKRRLEVRERGPLAGLGDFFLGIADPLVGPGINFEDQGILSGLEATFQPFQDAFIDPSREAIGNWWAHTADPDNPFRPHISLGQNMAISAGQDPNTWGYSFMSGAIDASTYIVFDPLSYVGSIAKGLGTAGRLALGTEAIAQGSRAARTLKAAVPFISSNRLGIGRGAVGLGWSGNKGWSARVTYNLFAKDVDTLLQGRRARQFGDQVVELAKADRFDEITRLYPDLAKNGELTQLAQFGTTDDFLEMLGEGMKGNLKSDKTIELAQRAVAQADDNLTDSVRQLAGGGTLDLADLTHIKMSTSKAMRNVDLVIPGVNGSALHRTQALADGARVQAWTRKPITASIDNERVARHIGSSFFNNQLMGRFRAAQRAGNGGEFIGNLSRGEIRRLEDFVSDLGYDMLTFDDGRAIIGRRGKDALMEVVDGPGTRSAQSHLSQQLQSKMNADYLMNTARNTSDELYWIDSLPTRSTVKQLTGIDTARLPKRPPKGSQAASQTWWRAYRTNRQAWMQGQRPKEFALFDRAAAIDQIKMHAGFSGMKDDVLARWLNDFAKTVPEERANFFGAMMEETAEIAGDWRMQYNLRWSNRHAAGTLYTHGDDGLEMALGPSKSRPGMTVGKPHEPGMLGKAYPAMDKTWYDEIARLRTARAKLQGGRRRAVTGRSWTRTSKKREELVGVYRRALKREGIDTAELGLGDDDLWAMAYATIDGAATGGKNGLGRLSQLADVTKKGWGVIHRGFTLTALATRPIIWPLKVIFGEESIRGQLGGMTNMFGHPLRYIKYQRTRHVLQRAKQAEGAITEAHRIAKITLRTKLDDALAISDNLDDLGRAADDLVPNWRTFVDDVTAPSDIRTAAARAVDDAFESFNYNLSGRLSFSDEITAAIKREDKAVQRVMKVFESEGSIVDELLEGFEEVNSDFFSDVAAGHIASQDPVGLSRGSTKQYAILRADEVLREAESPFMAFALERAIAKLSPTTRVPNVRSMIQTSEWRKMRRSVLDIAEGNGKTFLNDTDLAIWYFDDFYRTNYIERRFKHFVTDAAGEYDPDAALKFMTDFRNKEITLGDEVVNLRRGDQAIITQQWRQFLDDMFNSNVVPLEPTFATGSPDAMKMLAAQQVGWRNPPARVARWIVRTAGSKTTQKVTRQPAFLGQTDDYFRHFKTLGWTDERAAMAARIKAVEDVNHLMYNMENAPEILKTFNRIVPFGAAMFEVSKVWFWQLPVLQGRAGLGHIQLANKLKRFEYALEGIGIIQRDEEGNTRIVGRDGGFVGQNPFGASASTFLNKMFQAPALLAGQVLEIKDEVFGEGDFVAPALKKQHELRLGNPMRIDTEGLFAVNRFGIGLNPVASLVTTKLLDQSWLTSESVTITTTSGQNLDEFAQANGLEDAQELFDDPFNRELIRKKMPDLHAVINKDRFTVDFADFTAPSDLVFHIPNTGAIRGMFEDVLFPFGATNDLREMYLNYAPSSMQQVFRSFGVREDSDTFLGTLLGPLNTHSMNTAMIDGMAYAEMVHGFSGEALTALDKAGELQAALVEDGLAQWETVQVDVTDKDGETKTKEVRQIVESEASIQAGGAEYLERQAAIDEQWDIAKANDQLLIEYAAGYGMNRELSRGLTNFFIPGSPRAIDEQRRMVSEIWDGKDLAEAIKQGQGVQAFKDFLNRPHPDLGSAMQNVNRWLEKGGPDTPSTQIKADFFQDNPGLGMYLTPTRAYTGNPFPEFDENDIGAYVRRIQRGESTVLSPDTFMQRYWSTRLTWEQEIAEAVEFGEDPVERGIAFLWRWQEKSKMNDEFRSKRNALAFYDRQYMDHAYLELKGLERDDALENATQEQINFDKQLRRREKVLESITQQITDLDALDIDPLDKREMKDALFAEQRLIKSLVRGMKDLLEDFSFGDESDEIVSEWFDKVYDTYLDEKKPIWDELNDTEIDLTDADRSGLFGQLRQIENQAYLAEPMMHGQRVPNPQEYRASYRDEEAQRLYRYRAIGRKVQWLNIGETRDLMGWAVDQAIKAGGAEDDVGQWLPVSVEDQGLYDWYNNWQVELKNRRQAGGEDFLKQSQLNKINDNLDKMMRDALEEEGRYDEARFLFDFTPAQRLEVLYLMPDVLRPIFSEVNTFLAQLQAADLGPRSEQARREWQSNILPDLLQQIEGSSTTRQALINLGTFVNKKNVPTDILETIFLGQFMPLT